MESGKLCRIIFYAGSAWNFAMSLGIFLLVGSLPALLKIEEPRYPSSSTST